MRRGKNPFGMTEFSAGMPHDTVVDPQRGNIICRLDAGTAWFTETHATTPEYSGSEAQHVGETGFPEGEAEHYRTHESKRSLPKMPANAKISSLRKTKIKLRGKISELFSVKLKRDGLMPEAAGHAPEELEFKEEPQLAPPEPATSEPVAPTIGQVELKPPHVVVKLVPTPVKRDRSPKIQLGAEPAKPLKVIRRRREEAPKVFETVSSNFRKSMLEGIITGGNEEGDLPPE